MIEPIPPWPPSKVAATHLEAAMEKLTADIAKLKTELEINQEGYTENEGTTKRRYHALCVETSERIEELKGDLANLQCRERKPTSRSLLLQLQSGGCREAGPHELLHPHATADSRLNAMNPYPLDNLTEPARHVIIGT